MFGAGSVLSTDAPSTGADCLRTSLTHVIQQHDNETIQDKLETGQSENLAEREADQAADRIALGQFPLLNSQRNRSSIPSGTILAYRDKSSVNFNVAKDPTLKEREFVNPKTQPWIEQITLKFNGSKTDSAGDLIATGKLNAAYNANKAALPDIDINIVGGSTSIGLTDKGKGFQSS